MEPENEIDQLFKRGLNEPQIPFSEMDWAKMERKLDEKKKRRILPFWVFTASGIAATLLIFLFWFLSGPSVFEKSVKNPLAGSKSKPVTTKQLPAAGMDAVKEGRLAEAGDAGAPRGIEEAQNHGTGFAGDSLASEVIAKDHVRTGISASEPVLATRSVPASLKVPATISNSAPVYASAFPLKVPAADNLTVKPNNAVPVMGPASVKAAEHLNAPLTDSAILAQKAMALALSKDPLEKIHHTEIAKSVQKKMDGELSRRPNLILSAMAGPDITSGPANTNKSAKVSSNLGMLATYALGSKFSLTSGAIYAKKYYNYGASANGSSMYAPSTASTDWEVKADCNVIDIPVNVNYKLLDKKKFSMSVNTGLSSYFMLKEKYDYIVDKPGQAQQITTTEFSNQNQHILGIANVSVSFDHQISNNLSVGVQPFAKLPLTGIGNYDVNLKSTGVAFSINIGLFPSKKPGKLAANRYSSLY